MSARSDGTQTALRYTAPVTLIIVSLLFLLVAAPLKPLAAVLGGTAGAIILMLASAVISRPLGAHMRVIVLLMGIALVALLVGVFSRPAPLVSIAGVVGQHNGWALWACAVAWFAAGGLLGAGRPFRMLVWCVAVLGAIVAGAALLDPLLPDVLNYSPEPSGLMENSISLAQLLLLGIGASAALVAMETRPPLRLISLALTVVQMAALMVSGARGAQALLVLGAITVAVWVRGGTLGRTARAVAIVALAGILIGVGWLTVSAVLDTPAWAQQLLTARPTIWRTAATQVAARLLVGSGPDRFTSVIEWQNTGAGISWQTTASPHSVPLDWLLGGGLIALVAFLSAALLAGLGILRRVAAAPAAPKIIAVAVGAWALSLLISWVDPLSALVAALFSGVLLADRAPLASPSPMIRGALMIALAVLVSVLVVVLPLAGLEAAWVRDHRMGTVGYDAAHDRWVRWPDPAFGSDAVRVSLETLPERADEAGRLADSIVRLTPWDSNGLAGALQISAALESQAPETAHPDVTRVLEIGRATDPVSGMWDELEAAVMGSSASSP